jgi:hypothetical protein
MRPAGADAKEWRSASTVAPCATSASRIAHACDGTGIRQSAIPKISMVGICASASAWWIALRAA